MSAGIGNDLNQILNRTKGAVFNQGELAQLAHFAFEHAVQSIQQDERQEITLQYPVGYSAKKEPMVGTLTHTREELSQKYAFLAHSQIPLNGIYHLATIIEAMLGDLIRRVVLEFPKKIDAKKKVSARLVLDSTSLDEVRIAAVDGLIHELSYKSPREFAEEAKGLLSINLLECPAYHGFIEMKATRDVHIHNRGIANETYLSKTASHARVRSGEYLPVSQTYFLEVYEACLRFVEWMEQELHETWHSSEYQERKQTSVPPPLPPSLPDSG